MANSDDGTSSHRVGVGNQQLVIITQLLQTSVNMRHIDEMFLWLSQSIGQRLKVEVIQFWAYQGYIDGQYSAELRAAASQNSLFPLPTMNNAHIAEAIKVVLVKQSGVSPQRISNTFSAQQVGLLTRYNLHYWACFPLSSNVLLPTPMHNETSQGTVPTPLNIAVALFTQQPPHPHLQSNIKRILEQALSIANNRGLLSIANNRSLPSIAANPTFVDYTRSATQDKHFTINELIPHWTKGVNAIQAENPFARSTIIDDKQAQLLYTAIDGKQSIIELLRSVPLDQQEFDAALRYLIRQRHIRLHYPDGDVVNGALFLESQ